MELRSPKRGGQESPAWARVGPGSAIIVCHGYAPWCSGYTSGKAFFDEGRWFESGRGHTFQAGHKQQPSNEKQRNNRNVVRYENLPRAGRRVALI